MWKYASWNPKAKWIITGVFGLITLGNMIGSSTPKRPESKQVSTSTAPTSPTPQQSLNYQIKQHNDKPLLEYFEVLIDPKDNLQAENIANEVKKKCQKKCNIDIYDNEAALELDQQAYALVNKPSEYISWQTQHYVYLADHTLGQIVGSGTYTSYPYRDTDYDKLKAGGKLNPPETPDQIVADFVKNAQTVTVANIYKSPNSYKDKSIVFTCSVSGFPKDNNGNVAGLNCNDPNNYGSNVQVAIGSDVDVTKINDNDTIKVYGMGLGAIKGNNAFGAEITTGGVMGLYINDLTTGYRSY